MPPASAVWSVAVFCHKSQRILIQAMALQTCSSRRLTLHRAVLAAAAACVPSSPAVAWCGERFPSWAYYLKWDQASVPFEWNGFSSAVTYRIVGDIARETQSGVPPVLVAGSPGLGYEYMENMEALTVSDRRIIEVTFAPDLPIDSGGVQLEAVCRALKVPTVHLVAHGLGAVPALNLASAKASGSGAGGVRLRSFTLVSPYGAVADLRDDAQAQVLGLAASVSPPASPPASLPAVEPVKPSLQVGNDCSMYKTDAARAYCETGDAKGSRNAAAAPVAPRLPEGPLIGRAALLPTASSNARGSCIAEAQTFRDRSGAPPPVLERLLKESSAPRLAGAGLGKRLATDVPADVPMLLMSGGTRDIVDATAWEEVPPSVRRVSFGASGHLPFIEERDEFLPVLLEFLDTADGKTTNREFKFADPVTTVKEFL